ncbi:MAG TPA: WecB/TagA/CpsF family glycosyltransferase [Firmicutes bacterium]|nr:WecB/TagA/CpsF family glycosyltransferase [Bacillota bacterium]
MVSQGDYGTSEVDARVSVLDIPVHVISPGKALEVLARAVEAGRKMRIVTLNPEMVMWAQTDQHLAQAIRQGHLCVPDGIGVVWAMRRKGIKGQARIGGVDLIEGLLDHHAEHKEELKLFLLGGRPGVAQEAGERMKRRWPSVQIVGSRHGYFTAEEDEEIIAQVNNEAPDLLLVGMGLPRQELWLMEHWERLHVKLAVGIGGGLDLWAGRTKRAPRLVRNLGLEWLFRTLQEPQRFSRLMVLPKFVLEACLRSEK